MKRNLTHSRSVSHSFPRRYPDWSAPFLTEVSKHVSDVQDAFMPGVLMLSSDAPGTPGAYPASQVTDDPQHVLVGRLCTFDDPAAFCKIMKGVCCAAPAGNLCST